MQKIDIDAFEFPSSLMNKKLKTTLKYLLPIRVPTYAIEEELGMLETFAWSTIQNFHSSRSPRVFENPEDVPPRDSSKYFSTIIFDLDETLVHAKEDEGYYIRPFARFILEFLRSKLTDVEVIVWSAGARCHVECCLALLDPASQIFKYAVCRGDWMSEKSRETKTYKKISHLKGRCERTTLIFDDSYSVSASNPGNVIVVPRFEPSNKKVHNFHLDTTLYYSTQMIGRFYVLSKMDSSLSVCDHIENHPFVAKKVEKRKDGERIPHFIYEFEKNLEQKIFQWREE